jgi:hypothetical protein
MHRCTSRHTIATSPRAGCSLLNNRTALHAWCIKELSRSLQCCPLLRMSVGKIKLSEARCIYGAKVRDNKASIF